MGYRVIMIILFIYFYLLNYLTNKIYKESVPKQNTKQKYLDKTNQLNEINLFCR